MVAYFQGFERPTFQGLANIRREYTAKNDFQNARWNYLQPVALLVFRLQIKLGIEAHGGTKNAWVENAEVERSAR